MSVEPLRLSEAHDVTVATRVTDSPPDKSGTPPGQAIAEAPAVQLRLSFDLFFSSEFDRVARALALTTGNTELGRDAAAEGMARAYQRWSKISAYDNPGGWVYRVGLNWARSRLRKWTREVHIVKAPKRGEEAAVADTGLADALAELPLKLRSVVVLRYYLDLNVADTATSLGIAEGTVKSRTRRALDRLALELEDSDGNR